MKKLLAASASALLLAACGGGGGATQSSGSAAPSAPAASEGAIGSYTDAEPGVIQIVADGSYVSPDSGQMEQSAGAGSGFIIDPSGIAVTNMHVVEGAGSLDVFVGGSTKPINAKILGVSECNDLAVIDLQGDGFPYFQWADGQVTPAMNVWAAGFPLGDPEYTIVDGSIAKTEADGDTSWASLDYALQHTGQIQPGNSGGPLIDENGRVVGVNYAGGSPTNTEQFFAIPGDIAQRVVAVLQEGKDDESVGINGEAFYDAEQDLGGLWVYSVRSGSPASNAGVMAGDIVTKLEGRDVVKAKDLSEFGATKAGYCDVLRTRGADKPLAIEVYRVNGDGSSQYLTGEINNPNKPLTPISSISVPEGQEGQSGGSTENVEFVTVADDSGYLSVEMPSSWADLSIKTTDTGAYILAATNLDDFARTPEGSGAYFEALKGAAKENELQETFDYLVDDYFKEDISRCEETQDPVSEDFEGGTYIAANYFNCNGSDQAMYFGVTTLTDSDAMVAYLIAYNSSSEVDWANRALGSVVVGGS